VSHTTPIAHETEADAGLERIKHLEEQFASAPAMSRQRRTLSAAIRIEADAYRKSLDIDQAAATHDIASPSMAAPVNAPPQPEDRAQIEAATPGKAQPKQRHRSAQLGRRQV
jgi:hypothetical protein